MKSLLEAVRCGNSKDLGIEKKLVGGAYEVKEDGHTYKLVFLEGGIGEASKNDSRNKSNFEWSVVNGEIHVKQEIYILNKDGSITLIAYLFPREPRNDIKKTNQRTYKRIK